jgi:hypothetical protein
MILIGNNTNIKGFHVQEYRPVELHQPIKCCNENAWLGMGYYFWIENEFAHYWGQDKKVSDKYKSYEIYCADLNIKNCLNTVFNEEHYWFFRKKIEEVIQVYHNRKKSFNLDTIHNFLAENIWTKHGIEGIIYDDKPSNPRNKNRIYSEIPNLYYKKRIQIIIFDLKNINNFEIIT